MMASRVRESFVFSCNKGGVGKSTLVSQMAPQYAKDNPDVNVLIIDLTVSANVATLLLSREGVPLAVRSATFLGALSRFSRDIKGAQSWWPNLNWLRTQVFDWEAANCVTRVADIQPSSQSNLYLTVGGSDIRDHLDFENWSDMLHAWYRGKGAEVQLAEERQWVIFFDTDQSVHTPHARFALQGADKVVAPLELDEMDLERMWMEDEEEPGLFCVLKELVEQSLQDTNLPPPAKFHMLIFNKVQVKSKEVEQELGTPFTPVKGDQELLKDFGGLLLNLAHEFGDGISERLFQEWGNVAQTHRGFTRRYMTAVPKLPTGPLGVSKMCALPFADIDTTDKKPGAAVILPKGLPVQGRGQRQGEGDTDIKFKDFTHEKVADNQAIISFVCRRLAQPDN